MKLQKNWIIAVLTALLALFTAKEGYEYATAPATSPEGYELSARPPITIAPVGVVDLPDAPIKGEGIESNKHSWALYITYEVEGTTTEKPALPTLSYTYRYALPYPLPWALERPPNPEEVKHTPSGLKGKKYTVVDVYAVRGN